MTDCPTNIRGSCEHMRPRRRHTANGVDIIERMLRLGARVGNGERMTVQKIMALYNVSLATAKRDMVRLEAIGPV